MSQKPRMVKASEKMYVLGVDELGLIVNKLSDTSDRKSFSEVCKLWFKAEALTRSSIRLLRAEYVRQVLTRFPNIVTFKTSEPITNADVEFLGQNCPKIEVMDLGRAYGSIASDPLVQGLIAVANRCPKLSKVNLSRRRINDYAIVSFISLAHNLTHLDFGCCSETSGFSEDAVKAIASCGSIVYLKITWSKSITDRALSFLANGACSKTLKTLLLRWNYGITDVGISLLQKMHCLEQLDLASYSNGKITDVGGVAISAITTLKKLSLSDLPRLSDSTIVALAENCPNLDALDISGCKRVTGAGIRAFSNHLCLQTIDLSSCGFTALDMDSLVRGCPQLKSILVDSFTLLTELPMMQESTRRLVSIGSMSDHEFESVW